MILLNKVRLINWYAFNNVTVPIGKFSLIAGKNGNGKSVLLDAIKYGLYGDTVFNNSTEKSGRRTVSTYTRGLLDATAGTYMRPADKIPNIFTHIVFEMLDNETEKFFILGTLIETDSSNNFKTYRYIIENKKIDEIENTYTENDSIIPYNGKEFQKKYNIKLFDARDGIARFMQKTGLRLNEQQTNIFKRKLRSIMSYNPNDKIDMFIRNRVLEENKIDFSKLIEAKSNIDKLKNAFDRIDEEIKELDKILELFDQLENAENIIITDNIKIAYKGKLEVENSIKKFENEINIFQNELKISKEKGETLKKKENELNNKIKEVEKSLNSMNSIKAIREMEDELKKVDEEKIEIEKEKNRLVIFQNLINELLEWFNKHNIAIENKEMLSTLADDRYSQAEKMNFVDNFAKRIQEERDIILEQITRLKEKIKNNNGERERLQKIINDCNKKKTDFAEIPDYVSLKNAINNEFKKRKIASEAKFACEYVIGVTDEDWRDAIEAYLGKKRYTILVDPKYYDIADDVLNKSNNMYAHLFNTKLLMKKQIKVDEKSIVKFVDIKNSVAKKYFEYQLGHMRGVNIDEVKNNENAISKEGRVSASMDSFLLNFKKIKFYCLGQEAIELNKIKAEKNLKNINEDNRLLIIEKKTLTEEINYLDSSNKECFANYNYDAFKLYNEILTRRKDLEYKLNILIEAQKNNTEYIELMQLREEYSNEEKVIRKEIEDNNNCIIRLSVDIDSNNKNISTLEIKYNQVIEDLSGYQEKHLEIYKIAIDSYDKFIANGNMGTGGILKDRKRAERRLKEAGDSLIEEQATYNANLTFENRIESGKDKYKLYNERKAKIWIDDYQQVKDKLTEQTSRYEEIFKNEFVLNILKYCDNAKNELKLINAELSNLKFKSKYEFDVKFVKDGSDYEKILEYAQYLRERENLGGRKDQMTLSMVTDYSDEKGEELEEEIRKIVNRIVDSNSDSYIDDYADYRNYMSYEILLTNDVLNKAKLSRQSGYNSGAEVQIPYLLILLSALLMVYHNKANSTRLVFIDEPFAKMDPGNIKIMLDFMKKQELQMIFCAPDKIEAIGNECNVILPVLRVDTNLMEIGTIKFNKEM